MVIKVISLRYHQSILSYILQKVIPFCGDVTHWLLVYCNNLAGEFTLVFMV